MTKLVSRRVENGIKSLLLHIIARHLYHLLASKLLEICWGRCLVSLLKIKHNLSRLWSSSFVLFNLANHSLDILLGIGISILFASSSRIIDNFRTHNPIILGSHFNILLILWDLFVLIKKCYFQFCLKLGDGFIECRAKLDCCLKYS